MTTLALPEPPTSGAAPPARRPLLAQCLVLAGLLHLLLVLVLGNTPGGSARPGEGLWGAFQVRLVGTGPAGPPEAAAAETPETGAPGRAERQRFGGAVRPADAPRPSEGPGAARAGRWLPQAAEGDAQAPPLATSADPLAPAVPPIDSPPMAALPMAAPPMPVPPMPVGELPAHQSIDLARPLPDEQALAAPLQPPALPNFEVQPAPAPRVVAPRPPSRSLAPAAAVDLPPLAPPALPSFTAQALPSARQLTPRPLADTLAPPAAPDLPAVAAPALPRFAADAPLPARAVAPRPAEPGLAPLAGSDLPAAPAPPPGLPSFPVQAAPPPRTLAQRERPSAVGALAPAELAAAAADAPPLPSFAAQPAAPPAAPVPASPVGVKQVAGAPDAGSRVGHDLATAPSQPASAARLNLDLVRPRGGLIAPQASRGLLSVLPHPPELKSKLEKEIDLAGLADCRKAYSAMGLAALAPLAADALREKGCRW